MASESFPTRGQAAGEKVSRGFVSALVLHGAIVGGLVLAAFVSARVHPHFGDANPVAGAIAANVVSALPLPPKVFKDHEVLASEKPSVAPTPPPPEPPKPQPRTEAKPKAEPPPKPNEVLIPKKDVVTKTPAKPAEREQPKPATRPPVVPPPPTNKATTGETAGIQIPQSVSQLKNGTASVTVEERAFGDRYAYYVKLISQKINQSKSDGGIDPPDARGKKAVIHFLIGRDGVPSDIEVQGKSGSAALDASTLRAIQRIDTFGPLPQGNQLPVSFEYDSK